MNVKDYCQHLQYLHNLYLFWLKKAKKMQDFILIQHYENKINKVEKEFAKKFPKDKL